jgi:geranylgeranyl diphosphate synthase type II
LHDYLAEKRSQVETHLSQALRPRSGLPESLREAMRYSLLAPGKRLRPLLVVLAAEACGDGSQPWPAACAVEMIHAYSLIHDDLPAMDDDDLRRGLPTCHKKFGEALAILAGDALQSLAFELLAEGYEARTAAACCRELACAAGATGMVGGQVDDLAWESVPLGRQKAKGRRQKESKELILPSACCLLPSSERTIEGLEFLHARKTGALFRASLKLGVLAGHARKPAPNPEVLERFDGYGRCLGLAFQITDDLLDVEGHSEQAGKRVGKDAARGKLTYPGFLGVAESRGRAERLCREAREHLAPLGPAAGGLLELVSHVLERNH